jgi:hypothetical protein
MPKDDPPAPPPPKGGKVIPFEPVRRAPRMPPRPRVFDSILEAEMTRSKKEHDDALAGIEELNLDEGFAWVDGAIARGEEGAHEARADLLNVQAYRTLARMIRPGA